MNDDNIRNHAKRSMLTEVENWLVGSNRDFVLTKNPAPGFYTCREFKAVAAHTGA